MDSDNGRDDRIRLLVGISDGGSGRSDKLDERFVSLSLLISWGGAKVAAGADMRTNSIANSSSNVCVYNFTVATRLL